ncbi:MAG: hypothetical protein R2689_00570 [Microthrixaceae bacterium]
MGKGHRRVGTPADTDGTEPAPTCRRVLVILRDIHGPDGVIGAEIVGEFFGDYAEVVRQAITDATNRHRNRRPETS